MNIFTFIYIIFSEIIHASIHTIPHCIQNSSTKCNYYLVWISGFCLILLIWLYYVFYYCHKCYNFIKYTIVN